MIKREDKMRRCLYNINNIDTKEEEHKAAAMGLYSEAA